MRVPVLAQSSLSAAATLHVPVLAQSPHSASVRTHARTSTSSAPLQTPQGWQLLLNMVEELGSRSRLASRMFSAGQSDLAAFHLAPSAGAGDVRRHARSPRCRQRENRRKLVSCLVAMSMIALSWCRSGGIIENVPSVTPSCSWAKTLLYRKWTEACRHDPFSLSGDKRGRMRDFVAAIASGSTPDCSDLIRHLPFELGPVPAKSRGVSYDGPDPHNSSTVQPFSASRLSLPKRAALIPIDAWLHEHTRLLWNAPEADLHVEHSIRSYFPVSMIEWRATVRRMMRAGLATPLASNSRDPRLASGAFAVRKDLDKDRLIADRRPENAGEKPVGLCLLPYGPRLRRVQLKSNQYLRASVQDLSNMYYMFKVSEERLKRQVVGPRVPVSWFQNLESEAEDFLPDASFMDAWHWADVRPRKLDRAAWTPSAGEIPGMCQVALTAALMGDLNAVTVCQQAHRRMLLACGGLEQEELLLPGKPFPCGALFGDAYVDDLAVFLILHFSHRGVQEDEVRLARIFNQYENVGFSTNAKGVLFEADRVDVWGAELRGFRGTVGYGLQKGCTLSMVTLLACTRGLSGKQLSQLLGTWSYACAYRREALSVIDIGFLASRQLPQHRRTLPSGALLDELMALVGLMPLLESDLRAKPHLQLLASDASAEGLGGWAAPIDECDEDTPPSKAKERRRVRLFVSATEDGAISVLRFKDDPDEAIVDEGTAKGSLADAVVNLYSRKQAVEAVEQIVNGMGDTQ